MNALLAVVIAEGFVILSVEVLFAFLCLMWVLALKPRRF